MRIKQVQYETVAPLLAENVQKSNLTVDSFWEDHILRANHYGIFDQDILIGYFSIFAKNTVTSFYLAESHGHMGKDLFSQIKHFEEVTNAMVATGDEYFLSHCVDNFSRLEKQAYFSIYRLDPPAGFCSKPIQLVRITDKHDLELLKRAGDFFASDPVELIIDPTSHYRIYKVMDQDELVGFGVVETGRIVPSIASIGMYVMPEKRQQGYAKSILRKLLELMVAEGYEDIRSGCWYYNHNSLKSIIGAGGYSKTRLLRFYF